MHDEEAWPPAAPTPTVWCDILQAWVRRILGHCQCDSETREQKLRTKWVEERGTERKTEFTIKSSTCASTFVRNCCFYLQGISEKYLHTSQPYLFPSRTGYCRLLPTFRQNLLLQSSASECYISTGILPALIFFILAQQPPSGPEPPHSRGF
jgi:hypothetical protein